ncbi:MAG: MucBP domain-containing protein [Bacilli bacterium]|nr:MucBP domain-containing protein [Bacilli bacterium]
MKKIKLIVMALLISLVMITNNHNIMASPDYIAASTSKISQMSQPDFGAELPVALEIYKKLGFIIPGDDIKSTWIIENDTDKAYVISKDHPMLVYAYIINKKNTSYTTTDMQYVYENWYLFDFNSSDNGLSIPKTAVAKFNNASYTDDNESMSEVDLTDDVYVIEPGATFKLNWSFYFDIEADNRTNGADYNLGLFIPLKQQSSQLKISYVDEHNNEIATTVLKYGNPSEQYEYEPLAIEGYTYSHALGLSQGTFSGSSQSLTFVYTKDKKDDETIVNDKEIYQDEKKETNSNITTNKDEANKEKTMDNKNPHKILPSTGQSNLALNCLFISIILLVNIYLINKKRLHFK